jgi:hypothetical protein
VILAGAEPVGDGTDGGAKPGSTEADGPSDSSDSLAIPAQRAATGDPEGTALLLPSD